MTLQILASLAIPNLPRSGWAMAVAGVAIAAASFPVAAMPIHYGSFDGDTVFFETVIEEGNNGSPVLGRPEVSGDALTFGPNSNFQAVSSGGGTDAVTARLATIINADSGRSFDELSVRVSGDIDMLAIDQRTEPLRFATRVVAETRFEVRVGGVDGQELPNQVILRGGGILFEANLAEDGERPQRDARFTFDLAEEAAADGRIHGEITRLSWNVDLDLFAESEEGTRSSLGMNFFDAITLTVPEPTSAAVLAGSLGLILRRRRLDEPAAWRARRPRLLLLIGSEATRPGVQGGPYTVSPRRIVRVPPPSRATGLA